MTLCPFFIECALPAYSDHWFIFSLLKLNRVFAVSFSVMLVTIREDGRKTDILHILKTHQREGTKQKWVKHQEHIRPDQTSRRITKVERLSVLRLISVWRLLWVQGHRPDVSTARMPTSPPYFPCPPGTTWTSPSHLSLQWPPRSCGWPSTDTRRALCTPTSTMFSPRSEGRTHLDWWLMAFVLLQ